MKGVNAFLALDDVDEVTRVLRTYGATISKTVNTRTKCVITKKGDCDNFTEDLDKAADLDKPIIGLEWIVSSIEAGTQDFVVFIFNFPGDCEDIEEDEFKFAYKKNKKGKEEKKEKKEDKEKEKQKALKKVLEAEKEQKEKKEKAESKKRKVTKGPNSLLTFSQKSSSSSSEDQQPKLKKQKTAATTTTTTTTTTTPSTPKGKAGKAAKVTADAESSGLPIMINVPSQWMGVCSYDVSQLRHCC